MWSRPLTRVQIGLGYGAAPLVRCLNILLAHNVRIHKVTCNQGHFSSIIPVLLEVAIRHPGRNSMVALIAALNQISYGCREVACDFEAA